MKLSQRVEQLLTKVKVLVCKSTLLVVKDTIERVQQVENPTSPPQKLKDSEETYQKDNHLRVVERCVFNYKTGIVTPMAPGPA